MAAKGRSHISLPLLCILLISLNPNSARGNEIFENITISVPKGTMVNNVDHELCLQAGWYQFGTFYLGNYNLVHWPYFLPISRMEGRAVVVKERGFDKWLEESSSTNYLAGTRNPKLNLEHLSVSTACDNQLCVSSMRSPLPRSNTGASGWNLR